MGTGDGQIGRQLMLVEGEDSLVCQAQGVLQGRRCGLPGVSQPLWRNPQGIGAHAVKAFGELHQGGIAFRLHPGEDLLDPNHLFSQAPATGALGDGCQSIRGGV